LASPKAEILVATVSLIDIRVTLQSNGKNNQTAENTGGEMPEDITEIYDKPRRDWREVTADWRSKSFLDGNCK